MPDGMTITLQPDLAIAQAFWTRFAPGENIRLRFVFEGPVPVDFPATFTNDFLPK